jgi:hypothetical protein
MIFPALAAVVSQVPVWQQSARSFTSLGAFFGSRLA